MIRILLDGSYARAYQKTFLPKLQNALKGKNQKAIRAILKNEAEARREKQILPTLLKRLINNGNANGAASLLNNEKRRVNLESVLPSILNKIENGNLDGAQKQLRKIHEKQQKRNSNKRSSSSSAPVKVRGITLSTPEKQWTRRKH